MRTENRSSLDSNSSVSKSFPYHFVPPQEHALWHCLYPSRKQTPYRMLTQLTLHLHTALLFLSLSLSPRPCIGSVLFCGAVEQKKNEVLRITDNDDKKKKSQKVVSRKEKELANETKDLQTLATPSKMMVAVFVMVVMFSVQKRCGIGGYLGGYLGGRAGSGRGGHLKGDGGVFSLVGRGVWLACFRVFFFTAFARLSFLCRVSLEGSCLVRLAPWRFSPLSFSLPPSTTACPSSLLPVYLIVPLSPCVCLSTNCSACTRLFSENYGTQFCGDRGGEAAFHTLFAAAEHQPQEARRRGPHGLLCGESEILACPRQGCFALLCDVSRNVQ